MDIIISFLIATIIVSACVSIFYYFLESPVSASFLKFKTFIIFYNLNPEHWEIDDVLSNYVKFTSYTPYYMCHFYKFNYIDFYRFKLWKIKQKKKIKKEKTDKQMLELVEAMKYDISKIEKEAQHNLQTSSENILTILDRLKT